ncbi:electron transport complex subunit E [Endozoicomonas sp. SM1973]|uniref:Ion-translocating oxidoreductase complex subunit E n=1 Tax=Spartinivicinus marinus TaxID=2994442 RepID=A0A853I3K2_9GAMM|nr:electron transport complex subunit E [Spartinivicinus marinus]MCX4025473.1 electron transport complex subunit E [Spartinivicinus marinus]NYZ65298.1 electron transport complex subunit E [Spartinivicinus marinus]
MASADPKTIAVEGLWKNNPALVQLLGLCPLLGVSNSVVNAIGLGFATLIVLTCSNLAVSLIRNHVTEAIRLPAFVMIIAAFTSCVELLMQAFTYELYQILGLFIPLIVTNCTVLGRADAFASKHSPLPSILDGLMMGTGFALVLILLGAVREAVGQGTLFANMHLLFGNIAENWTITLIADYKKFLFAVLPPGAFVFMGFFIAIKNLIDAHQAAKASKEVATGSKRVRVTGQIS